MEQLFFAGKAYLKINSLVKTPLHEFMAVNAPGYGLLVFHNFPKFSLYVSFKSARALD